MIGLLHGLAALAGTSASPLTTTGSWVLDQGVDRCGMAQHFQGPDGEIKLSIYRRLANRGALIELEREGSDKAKTRTGVLTITIDGQAGQSRFVAGDVLGSSVEVVQFVATPEQFGLLENAKEVAITTGDGIDVDLAPNQLPAAFAMLKGCSDRLLRRLGIDPTVEAKIAVPAERLAGDAWITSADYPKKARRAGKGGVSFVVWTVDAVGTVGGCRTVLSSGTPILDQTACTLIEQRGRYRPARDAAGAAIASHDAEAVFWLPGAPGPALYRRSPLEFLLDRSH